MSRSARFSSISDRSSKHRTFVRSGRGCTSLAVGLTIQIRLAFPHYAAAVAGIVLAAVVIFEIAGPLLTRCALLKTGEAKTMPEPLQHATSADVSI
jgi:hypothetical protein